MQSQISRRGCSGSATISAPSAALWGWSRASPKFPGRALWHTEELPRLSLQTSKLDARVEHDRATLEAGKLEDLIATALSRYNSVASMRGTLRSGNTERAEREAAADTAEAARLVAEVTAIDASKFGSQNFEKLADCLADSRVADQVLRRSADKCRAAIATADHERDHLLEDLRVETAARLVSL